MPSMVSAGAHDARKPDGRTMLRQEEWRSNEKSALRMATKSGHVVLMPEREIFQLECGSRLSYTAN